MVEIEDISVNSMKDILKYFYLDVIPEFNEENALTMYYSASLFFIDQFRPGLRMIIRDNMDFTNVYDVIYIAEIFNDDFLFNICATYLAKNIQKVSQTKFNDIPLQVKKLTFEKLNKMGK
jgi:hypothetical protein